MRDEALSFIRTAFALASGNLGRILPQEKVAANALSAFLKAPELASEGFLNESDYDFSGRPDFEFLFEHAGDIEPEDALDYVRTLEDEVVAKIVASSKMFFDTVINETEIIPMEASERELLKAMIERECSSSTHH